MSFWTNPIFYLSTSTFNGAFTCGFRGSQKLTRTTIFWEITHNTVTQIIILSAPKWWVCMTPPPPTCCRGCLLELFPVHSHTQRDLPGDREGVVFPSRVICNWDISTICHISAVGAFCFEDAAAPFITRRKAALSPAAQGAPRSWVVSYSILMLMASLRRLLHLFCAACGDPRHGHFHGHTTRGHPEVAN